MPTHWFRALFTGDGFSLGLQTGVLTLWLGLVAALAVGIHRLTQDSEVIRKVVHIGAGNVIVLAWWLQTPAWVGMGASILFSAIALLSYWFPLLPAINSVGRKSLGTFFYAISIGLLIARFWLHHPYYAVLGVLIMAWGDGLAALVGQRWGNHGYQIWEMRKSWEGSFTMAAVSALVCGLVLMSAQGNIWPTWIVTAAIAPTAMGLEAFSKWGIDNLTVPLGAAYLSYGLNEWLCTALAVKP